MTILYLPSSLLCSLLTDWREKLLGKNSIQGTRIKFSFFAKFIGLTATTTFCLKSKTHLSAFWLLSLSFLSFYTNSWKEMSLTIPTKHSAHFDTKIRQSTCPKTKSCHHGMPIKFSFRVVFSFFFKGLSAAFALSSLIHPFFHYSQHLIMEW